MFKFDESFDINQISHTGARAIGILGLLIQTPASFEEIRQKLIEADIFEENQSDDILRIDLNTLKSIGCELSRPLQSDGYKYRLLDHPFKIDLTLEDAALLKKVFAPIESNADLTLVKEYDKIFKKLAGYVSDEKVKQALLGITSLKRYDMSQIDRLLSCCKDGKMLELIYKKPTVNKPYKKKVIAEKLVFNNGKIYLHCYDTEIQSHRVLSVKGIKEIVSESKPEIVIKEEPLVVRFKMKNNGADTFKDTEKVIERNDEYLVIEGKYFNKFLATQRMLYFGPRCTVLEPQEFRNHVISKLKEMKKIYEKD